MTKIEKMLPVIGFIIAGSLVMAQKEVHNQESLFWYTRNSSGVYAFDHQGADPTTACSGSDEICAKGFSTEQNASQITDNTVSQETRLKDE